MRARRQTLQLELVLEPRSLAEVEDPWQRVQTLNARTQQAFRERRKLVKPKRRQAGLFDAPEVDD